MAMLIPDYKSEIGTTFLLYRMDKRLSLSSDHDYAYTCMTIHLTPALL